MLFLYYHQQLQQSLKAALVLFFFENFKYFLLYDILLKFIPISRMGELYPKFLIDVGILGIPV